MVKYNFLNFEFIEVWPILGTINKRCCIIFRPFNNREQNFTRLIHIGPYAVNIKSMKEAFVFLENLFIFLENFLKDDVYFTSSMKALKARNAAMVLIREKPVETESPRRRCEFQK